MIFFFFRKLNYRVCISKIYIKCLSFLSFQEYHITINKSIPQVKKEKKESSLAKITLHLLVYIDMRSLTNFIPINFKNNFWNNQNVYIFLKIKLSFDNLLQMCIHIQCTILDCNILRYMYSMYQFKCYYTDF